MKIFDLRSPAYATGPATNSFTHPLSASVLTVPASGTELLTLDWNKYRPFVLATAGVDKMVKVWDCRMVQSAQAGSQAVGGLCEVQLPGHEYAVRKVQWSPHRPDIMATASYDMTCRMYVDLCNMCGTYRQSNMVWVMQMVVEPERRGIQSSTCPRSSYGVCGWL